MVCRAFDSVGFISVIFSLNLCGLDSGFEFAFVVLDPL